jgi:iron complex outermembrane receptor protein
MKKIVATLGLGLVVYALCAQNADTVLSMKSFTVQGIRTSDSLENSAKQSSIISAGEVKDAPAQSISQVFNYQSSLDVRDRGGLGVQSDLSIRGGSFDQSLIMIDGVKLSDPQTGHHLMDLPVFIDQVERVEVISNGGSRWFGPYAFAGAVNLITQEAEENQMMFRLSGGEYGYLDAGISGSLVSKKTSTTISVNHRRSDGYMTNTDFEMSNVSVVSSIDLKPVELKINAGATDKAFGAQNFYTSFFPTQYEETRTYFASIQAPIDLGKLKITPRLYYRRHYDRFELYRNQEGWYEWNNGYLIMENDTAPAWYKSPNFHRSEVRAAELNGTFKSKIGLTSIGAEYRHEQIRSNNLGELADTVLDYEGAIYTKYDSRENTSLFAEHDGKIKNLSYSIGLLANFHSVYGNDVFPGLDLSYKIGNSFDVFAGANRNMRFPTFTDLYYNLGGAQGSKDLKPEESINYQLGFGFSKNSTALRATGFYREGKNLIDWIRYNGTNTTVAANLTEVNFIGLELEGNFKFQKEGGIMDGIVLRYTYLDADKSSEGFESNYVLDYLKHKLYVGIDHNLVGTLKARWAFRAEDRVGGYFDASQGKEVDFELYNLVDVRVYQEVKGINWYVEVVNLFNTNYRDIGLVQQPGRWLRLGVSYKLKLSRKP